VTWTISWKRRHPEQHIAISSCKQRIGEAW
jgi:hypothetical protein